jgi:caa(3)-type oxidase subunit IV
MQGENRRGTRMTHNVQTHHHPNYVAIWYWLIGLALGSVLVSALPLPHPLVLVIIFAAAFVKAWLVALYYMHLRFEHLLIFSLVVVPLAFFGILLLVLFYDTLWPQQVAETLLMQPLWTHGV